MFLSKTIKDNVYSGELFLVNEFCKESKTIELVGNRKDVLEIGCANGRMTRLLRKNNCSITGIELNPDLANVAEQYCHKLIIGNVEEDNIIPSDELFDVILMADLIEHLAWPDNLLRKLYNCLKPGGYLVIAVPNVTFLTMRLRFVFGRFDYAEGGGILDSTHLRFFTLKTFRKLLVSTNYWIEKFYAAPFLFRGERLRKVRMLRLFIRVFNGILPMYIARLFPTFMAYSFVVRAFPEVGRIPKS